MQYSEKEFAKFNNVRQRIMFDAEKLIVNMKNAKTYEELEHYLSMHTYDMDSTLQDCINTERR